MSHSQICTYFWLLDYQAPSSCSFIEEKLVKLSYIWKLYMSACFSQLLLIKPWKRCTILMVHASPPGLLLDLMCHQRLPLQWIWEDMYPHHGLERRSVLTKTRHTFSHQPLWGQGKRVTTGQEHLSWIMWECLRRWRKRHLSCPKLWV